ncbi:hypothetical protein [Psychrosphaera algicola]|uniref:hypothetical protein n=1 Tax=Psychrosphaera algicola TaxID=3023714 RepID=UPI00351D825D
MPFDYQLVEQDIVGSKAWATAICEAGVISEAELTDLKAALDELLSEVRSGQKKSLMIPMKIFIVGLNET